MKRMALIPARSGSKGLKDKNIIDLCGKPLMAYSIEPAIESGLFDQVIVSTDSEHYADIARRYGSSVIMRSAELASDTATSFEVIADVLHRQVNMPDELVLLQPTSPMRTVKHIHEAVSLDCTDLSFVSSCRSLWRDADKHDSKRGNRYNASAIEGLHRLSGCYLQDTSFGISRTKYI